jgi:chloramphenicol 3-O-phosphotransferase
MSAASIIVVNGPIASGKSTVATMLAGIAEKQGRRSAVIDLDLLWLMLDHQLLRSGKLEHWLVARRAAAVLTDEFIDSGVELVVINGPFFTTEERAAYLRHLRSTADVRFVTLRVSFEESYRRVQADQNPRPVSNNRDWLGAQHAVSASLLMNLPSSDLIIDTDDVAPETVASQIAGSAAKSK